MSIDWAGLGPELLLKLDRSGSQTLGAQLERELREAIRAGRLVAGERLPSSRRLADELGVSRGLVQEGYAQLLAEGFLTARSGSGTRVAARAAEDRSPATTARSVVPARAPRSAVAAPERRPRIEFRAGVPELGSFPRADWTWAVREATRAATPSDFAYSEPRGSRRLRDVLSAYLRRVRGAVVQPDRIVICAGFQQGMNLVLDVLARRGVTCLALEDPGDIDPGAIRWRWGLHPVAVAVDEQGIDVAALSRTPARAAVLTPAHQSPTGVVLAPERRRALARWAAERDATIIEDDYDAEFRYDRDPVGALQGLAHDRVALIGTVSKSLAPALRLGWIVCPAALADDIAAAKEFGDRGSPGIDQLALAALMESGRYDRHLRRMRAVYAGKRQALIEALAEHAPAVELQGLAAGFHAIARLPGGVDERAVVRIAAQRGVGLQPLGDLCFGERTHPQGLVVGFGNLSEPEIRRGIATVGDLLGGAPSVRGEP